jgi:hypothetical protein
MLPAGNTSCHTCGSASVTLFQSRNTRFTSDQQAFGNNRPGRARPGGRRRTPGAAIAIACLRSGWVAPFAASWLSRCHLLLAVVASDIWASKSLRLAYRGTIGNTSYIEVSLCDSSKLPVNGIPVGVVLSHLPLGKCDKKVTFILSGRLPILLAGLESVCQALGIRLPNSPLCVVSGVCSEVAWTWPGDQAYHRLPGGSMKTDRAVLPTCDNSTIRSQKRFPEFWSERS